MDHWWTDTGPVSRLCSPFARALGSVRWPESLRPATSWGLSGASFDRPATAVFASSPPPPPGPPAARPRNRHARCLPPRHDRARRLPGSAPLTAPRHDPARCRGASSIFIAWDGTGTDADACSVQELASGGLLPARRSLVAAAASSTRVALPRGCAMAQ